MRAKAAGATIRVGPELELMGYCCEEHFLEQDTTAHVYITISLSS
jgi:NAD+ synthase (glutamine-hydrolysing)